MAGTVPQEARALYTFANTHAQEWVDSAAVLGLSPAQAAEVLAKVPELKEAIAAADLARQAAMNATQQMNAVARELFDAAAGAVRTIRAHAQATDNGTIYAIAGIEPPKVRSRQAAPPSAPTALDATINSMGEVILTWKTRQPRGVSNVTFAVHRLLNNDPATTKILDIASGRTFTDTAVPQGTRSVHYRLVPRRGSQEGPASADFTLRLGSVVPTASLAAPSALPHATTVPPSRRAA